MSQKFMPLVVCAIGAALAGWGEPAARATTGAPVSTASATAAPADERPSSSPAGLHNLMQLSHRIYSGSEPLGEEGFASLERMGVTTVVSVDGATPKVELAGRYGLRYVHIPLGYDTIPTEAREMLFRVVKECHGPIYVHCHHGRHRGPAAAAIACMAAGDTDARGALQMLQRAGTSRDYAGLWRDVENYVPPPANAELPELVSAADVSSLTAAMARIDRAFDNLKLCRAAQWNVPRDHPDLVPSQEALLLKEAFHEAGRNAGDGFDEQFMRRLIEAEDAADRLWSSLKANGAARAEEPFALVERSCRQCHEKYRDRPEAGK